MRKQLSENWQLWILMASIFLALSAGARKLALDYGWSDFNANILFIISFIALSIVYLVFHELSVKLFQPLFDKLFKKLGFTPRTDNEPRDERIVIDYAATREERIRKQEKRYIDLESRVIRYIGDTMSPYTTDTDMSKLIELSCEFFHMKLAPDFQKYDALKVSDELSTMDLMHFGWSIAKPFRKPCGHTALFLKQIFPDVFRNTEVFTIEKKLCLSPMQGRIKINRNVDKYGMAESIVDTQTTLKTSKNIKTKAKCSAKQAALSDMLEEGISNGFDLEGTLIED